MNLEIKNFTKYLNYNFVFEKNPSVAVAVSGGPDSIALSKLINEWCISVNGKNISLIVDHGLRMESFSEAISVSNYLKEHKINNKVLKVEKNKISKKNMKEARVNRYKLLTDYCRSKNILYLFVGHHKDDKIETFLNRKISGSDFDGLQEIKQITLKNQTSIIRPLLDYSKQEIVKFNNINRLKFLEDPSNQNFNYTRPVIRRFLNESSLSVKKKITKEFLLIQNNSKLYNQMISEQLIKNIIKAKKNFIKTNYENFIKLDILILEKIIKKIYYYFNNQDVFLKSKKIQILIKNLKNRNFKFFNLRSMIVKKDINCLIFCKKNQ